MPKTNEKWWHKYMTRIAKSDYAPCADAEDVEQIVSEAERRGHERAMEEVRRAADLAILAHGEDNTEDVYIIHKSFFEK